MTTIYRNKTSKELKETLNALYKKKIKILLEKTSNTNFKNGHLLKKTKKEIAKILTIITEVKKK